MRAPRRDPPEGARTRHIEPKCPSTFSRWWTLTLRRQLLIQNVPTCMVLFNHVDEYAVGGAYDRLHLQAWLQDVHHQPVMFVDAQAGQFLTGITYQ